MNGRFHQELSSDRQNKCYTTRNYTREVSLVHAFVAELITNTKKRKDALAAA